MVRRRSRTVGSLWADGLVHGWVPIVAWAASAAALTGLMMALEPAAVDAWEYFDVLLPETSGADVDRVAQYIALSASLMIPIIAGHVVARSAKWTSDFTSGRVGLLLEAPVTHDRRDPSERAHRESQWFPCSAGPTGSTASRCSFILTARSRKVP